MGRCTVFRTEGKKTARPNESFVATTRHKQSGYLDCERFDFPLLDEPFLNPSEHLVLMVHVDVI